MPSKTPRLCIWAFACLVILPILALGPAPSDADDTPAPTAAFVGAGTQDGQSGHALLSVDRLRHDYGVVEQHEVYKTTFTYRNDTASPIDGIAVRPGCGCLSATLSHKRLEVGQSGTLEVNWHTTTMSGRSAKTVELHNRSERIRGKVKLRLKIQIVGGLIVSPGAVNFGDVKVGSRPTGLLQLRWMPGQGKAFEITEATTPGSDAFTLTTTPITNHPDGWRGYQIALTPKAPLALGMISSQLLIRTNHPDRKRIVVPIQGNVCGAVWLQSHKLDFSMMRRGRPRTLRIRFRPFDANQRFGNVTARAPKGVLEVSVAPVPRLGNGQWWNLEVTVPADAPAGSLDGHTVELDVGIPGEPKTILPVRGTVRDRSQRGG